MRTAAPRGVIDLVLAIDGVITPLVRLPGLAGDRHDGPSFRRANERRGTGLQPTGRRSQGGALRKRRVEASRRPAAQASGLQAVERDRFGEFGADLVAGNPF